MLELKVNNQIINYTIINNEDYISITYMLKSKDGDFFITDWLTQAERLERLNKIEIFQIKILN